MLLTTVLLTAGLVGPASGEPALEVPTTAAATLAGLPAASAGGRVSKQVTTPMPFSMVGFEVPPGATLSFRTSIDGRTWSAWTEAEVEPQEGPDPGSAEAARATPRMSQPVWVGEASRIQTRLDGGRPAVHAGQVGVHLIDSSGLARSWGRRVVDRLRAAWRGTPRAADATPTRPAIVTRSQWGADESLRRGGPAYASKMKLGIVHHTAGTNGYSRAQADDVVRGVYRYHVQSNGWSDIGYNFLVDRFGTVYEGRYGGVARTVIGAHAGGFNTSTFGVSLVGSFDGVRPPKAMRQALQRLLAWKFDVHHLNVLGSTTYTSYGSSKYGAGSTVRLRRLSGHRDVSSTACPGGQTYELLPRLRRRVADLQGPVIHSPHVSPSSVRIADGSSVSGPFTFAARLRPAGRWTLTVRSPAGTVAHTATGYSDVINTQWLPTRVKPGAYRYAITSVGRRAVVGTVRLRAPQITASASATSAVFGKTGYLRKPVSFSARLWDGAPWRLRVTNPAGQRVFFRSGTGATVAEQWAGPVSQPGTYGWRVATDGATPVSGTIRVTADFVDRTGVSTDVPTAAAAISRRTFAAGSAKWAVLTPSTSSALALGAGALAGKAGPVLYTGAASVPTATLTELQRVLPPGSPLYLMGGEQYISDAQAVELGQHWVVQRMAGSKPAEVAASAAVVIHARRPSQSTAILSGTSGSAWRQGAAGPAYAARHTMPLLLTGSGSLAPAAKTAMNVNGITKVIIVGNSKAVSDTVAAQVRDSLPGREVVRVGGSSGAKTAVGVARKLFRRTASAPGQSWRFGNLGRSDGWVRALASAPLGARTIAPLLSVGSTATGTTTRNYLADLDYAPTRLGSGVVVGNNHHVAPAVRNALVTQLQ